MTPPGLRGEILAAEGALAGAGIAAPRVDAELLAAHVLGIGRGELAAAIVTGGRDFDAAQLERFRGLVDERGRRVPLQHLTGVAYFRQLELSVGPGVFIPRPETELLAELGVDAGRRIAGEGAPGYRPLLIDLCTGSGAVALALATEVAGSRVVGVELSEHAFAWAGRNLRAHDAALRSAGSELELVRADATTALAERDGTADVVTANPPYIPDAAVPREAEVRDHDPAAALYGGGPDGLEIPGLVLARAAGLLRAGGFFAMEHGEEQGPAVRELMAVAGAGTWESARTHRDLTGRDRVTSARRGPAAASCAPSGWE